MYSALASMGEKMTGKVQFQRSGMSLRRLALKMRGQG